MDMFDVDIETGAMESIWVLSFVEEDLTGLVALILTNAGLRLKMPFYISKLGLREQA